MYYLFDKKGYYLFIKRFLDILLSATLILLLSLPMIMIAIVISVSSEGGAIFKQKRIGRNGRAFVCYKFRTMYRNAPKNLPTSHFVNAEKYVTPVGRILRKTSLDELPQLFNVLKGDMSLVGPRPLIEDEHEIHDLRSRCGVYRIRPGITGLAQISGRDRVTDVEKARYDVRYMKSMSFKGDIKIIFNTMGSAFFGKGVAY